MSGLSVLLPMSDKKARPIWISMHVYLTSVARYNICGIIELLGHCKGGKFTCNIYICAWFGYFICRRKKITFYLFGKELISRLMRTNVRAIHENPAH